MSKKQGRLWAWRRRVAYRLLARPEDTRRDADADVAPVRLDYPGTDIWLRATSMPERAMQGALGTVPNLTIVEIGRAHV